MKILLMILAAFGFAVSANAAYPQANPTAGALPVSTGTNFLDSVAQSVHGNFVVGNTGTDATRTTNFLYIPMTAGPPVGVPVSEGGRPSLAYDVNNSLLYGHDATGWHIIGTNIWYGTNNFTINPSDWTVPYRVSTNALGDTGMHPTNGVDVVFDGAIIFGQGNTNVLKRVGTELVYTNADTGPGFRVFSGTGASATFGVDAGNNGHVASSSGFFYVDNTLIANDILPETSAYNIGANTAPWRDAYFWRTNYENELIITNGVTLGGVRRTSWPSGGGVNPTSTYLPYNNAGTFADAPMFKLLNGLALTDRLYFSDTNTVLYRTADGMLRIWGPTQISPTLYFLNSSNKSGSVYMSYYTGQMTLLGTDAGGAVLRTTTNGVEYLGSSFHPLSSNTVGLGTSVYPFSGLYVDEGGAVRLGTNTLGQSGGSPTWNGAAWPGGAGSQTPWTSDIDGGGYALTNVSMIEVTGSGNNEFNGDVNVFTSQLADNATNVALVVDTANDWTVSGGSLLNLRIGGTNLLRTDKYGGIIVGREDYLTLGNPFVVYPMNGGSFLGVQGPDDANFADITTVVDATEAYVAALDTDSSEAIVGPVWGKGSEYTAAKLFTTPHDPYLWLYDNDGLGGGNRTLLLMEPGITNRPYRFDTLKTLPSSRILEISNNTTNVFTVAFDGSVTTAGTYMSTLQTTWTAAAVGTNFVADLSKASLLWNMTTNLNIIHTTNGLANFTTNVSYPSSFKVINNSGTNFPVSWPATWHTLGTLASGFTLTNGDYCDIALEFAGPSTSQTNNWIGVAYKQY